MGRFPKSIQNLIENFERLPSIGHKTAIRIVMFMLNQNKSFLNELSVNINQLQCSTQTCQKCFNFSETSVCSICSDANRNSSIICVVSSAQDILSFEASDSFKGTYHVLQGLISPMEGISPDDLRIKELLNRTRNSSDLKEILFALGSSIESIATVLYLSRILNISGITITELAYGISSGTEIENADPESISKAIKNRKEVL